MRRKPNLPICLMCEQPIKPEEFQANCKNGVNYHQICYSLAAVSLEAGIQAMMRAHPEMYTELANGCWVENEDLEKMQMKPYTGALWGGNLRDPSCDTDLNLKLK